jgi:hypothetical protein
MADGGWRMADDAEVLPPFHSFGVARSTIETRTHLKIEIRSA